MTADQQKAMNERSRRFDALMTARQAQYPHESYHDRFTRCSASPEGAAIWAEAEQAKRTTPNSAMVANSYNPDEPRNPAGTAEGGQWTDGASPPSAAPKMNPTKYLESLPTPPAWARVNNSHAAFEVAYDLGGGKRSAGLFGAATEEEIGAWLDKYTGWRVTGSSTLDDPIEARETNKKKEVHIYTLQQGSSATGETIFLKSSKSHGHLVRRAALK